MINKILNIIKHCFLKHSKNKAVTSELSEKIKEARIQSEEFLKVFDKIMEGNIKDKFLFFDCLQEDCYIYVESGVLKTSKESQEGLVNITALSFEQEVMVSLEVDKAVGFCQQLQINIDIAKGVNHS